MNPGQIGETRPSRDEPFDARAEFEKIHARLSLLSARLTRHGDDLARLESHRRAGADAARSEACKIIALEVISNCYRTELDQLHERATLHEAAAKSLDRAMDMLEGRIRRAEFVSESRIGWSDSDFACRVLRLAGEALIEEAERRGAELEASA